MEISFSSIFSSMLSVSLLIILLLLFLKQKLVVTRFGLGCLYVFLILILFRGFLPIDFYSIGLTTSIYSEHILPTLRDFFLKELWVISDFSVTPLKIILGLWILGSFISVYRFIKSTFTLRKRIKSSEKIMDEHTLLSFQSAFETIFHKQKPVFQLVKNDCFGSPAIIGIHKPVIVLPYFDYTEEALYLVFRHELLHYKHKDYIFKISAEVLCVIYWWNPLVTLLYPCLLSQIQELWVDYQISKSVDKNQRVNYQKTLVTTLKSKQYSPVPTDVDMQVLQLSDKQNKNFVRQRINYIQTSSKIKSFTFSGVLICLALFLSTYTIVLEPRYTPSTDEEGNPVFDPYEKQIYFIKNGDTYDMYMDNVYIGTATKIPEDFKDYPIYNNQEEVPRYED